MKFHWRSLVLVASTIVGMIFGQSVSPENTDLIHNSSLAILSLIGVLSRKD